jgi:small subunit ribosomal protein S1
MATYTPPALDSELESLLATPVEPEPVDASGLDEGLVVDAVVHELDEDFVYVRLGEDQFGRCIVEDAVVAGATELPAIGDTVRVFIEEQLDDSTWTVSLAKGALIDAFGIVSRWKKDRARVRGRINLVVRGGFAVEVCGLRCFLPGRESAIPQHAAFEAVGKEFDFEVIRFDKKDAQPVLSRRSFAAEERKEAEAARMAELEVGQVIDGVVSSVRPFGVFVDLGGVDGLCHVSELSLQHVGDPSELVSVGDAIRVTITEIDTAKGRIGLSRREVLGDAQRDKVAALETGAVVEGRVTRIADFGAFIEVTEGVEGLLHVSELSWTERHAHVADVLTEGDTVRVKVLASDPETGRISLSLRALSDNPWAHLAENLGAGTLVEGEITRIEDYGLFVRLDGGVEGLCHISDLTWEGRPARPSDAGDFAVGQTLTVRILSVDAERGRVSLGLKQVDGDPWDDAGDRVTVGTVFTAPVVRFDERAAYVQVADGLEGRLHISQISEERVDSIRAALRMGQEVEVMVTNADRDRRRLDVSIRAVQEKIEAETPKSYADDTAGMNPLAEALKKGGVGGESED